MLALVAMPTIILQAASESYIQTLTGKLKKGDSCTVIDDKFLHLPLADWNKLNHLSVDNIISFELRFDTSVLYNTRSFSCKLNVSIKYFTSRDQLTPEEINNIDLVIKYDSAKGSSFPSNAFYKFKNAFKVVVVINSITSQEWGQDIPAAFRLKSQILVERKYPFSPEVTGGLRLTSSDEEGDGNNSGGGMMAQRVAVNKTAKQLKLSWLPADLGNGEEFDVEWTYIDGASFMATQIREAYTAANMIYIPAEVMAGWMRNNNTRVTVTNPEYTINIPYRDGYVLFRARGAYNRVETGVRELGPWVYLDNVGNQSLAVRIEEADAMEPGLNWQYTAAFAEEGKRKEVITYFDGSLRNRQAVTLSNSDRTLVPGSTLSKQETAIVQESIYDLMGRPAMNILPAPVKSKSLGFYRGFNRNSSDVPLSHTDILLSKNSAEAACAVAAGDLINTAGAAKYYSANNPFLGEDGFYFTKYVPDAEKRPYSLIQYTPDNTGKIRAQGQPGKTLLIENGKGTYFWNGKPGQKELDRLFGSEVGNASHYLKSMVIDPNNQVSVSYMDANGKTIATALAGDPAKNTDPLPSSITPGARISMTQPLIEPANFRRDAANMIMQSSATFLVPVLGPYQVGYTVNPASLVTVHGQGQFCSNCSYEVLVQVHDDCGALKGISSTNAFTINDASCNPTAQPVTGTVTINADRLGEYTVTYTLRLSKGVVKYQEDYYIANNSNLKKLQAFFDEELLKLDLAGCYTTCEECKTLGTTVDDFRSKVLDLLDNEKFAGIDPAAVNGWIGTTWSALKQKCSLISCNVSSACEDYLLQMKNDVRPGGQYALYAYDEATDKYSFLESVNVMPFYTQHDLLYTNESGETANANQLSESDFIRTYITHPEWADVLVQHHIEYCSYEWCKDANNGNKNEASYNFDKTLREMVVTGDDALSGGYYSRQNIYKLLDEDPFFKAGGRGAGLRTAMANDINDLSNAIGFIVKDQNNVTLQGKNIFQFIDWMLYCRPTDPSATVAQFTNSWLSCPIDGACRSVTAEWELYRNYYLQLKAKYLQLVKEQVNPNCKNCFIGKDAVMDNKCIAPASVSDYSIISKTEEGKLVYKIVYKNQTEVFPDNYNVSYQYVKQGVTVTKTVTITRGSLEEVVYIVNDVPLSSISITNVACPPGGGLSNCSLTGDTFCPTPANFTHRSVRRLDYDFYDVGYEVIQNYEEFLDYSGPTLTSPLNLKITRAVSRVDWPATLDRVIENTEYIQTLEPGQTSILIGTSMWQWNDGYINDGLRQEVEWTYYAVFPSENFVVCPPALPSSSCTNDPNYAKYAGKNRIFNEFVALDLYKQCLTSSPPPVPGQAGVLGALRNQAIANLDFLKTNWKERLMTVRDEESVFSSISNTTINDLTDALFAIAQENINVATTAATIRPASTLPSGVTVNGYNSFQDAFSHFISASLIQQGFSPYLLDKPYPYNKTPVEVNPNVSEINQDICTKLAALRSRFSTSGYSSFHTWLRDELGEDYLLTEAQLTDLENRCGSTPICRYLESPLVLPAALATPAPANADHPFVDCGRISALTTDFGNMFPAVTSGTRLYYTLYTNFLNHKLGYALSYGEYVTFKNRCISEPIAVLYNKPATPTLLPDNLQCVANNLVGAYERAGREYDHYIAIEREKFRNQYIAKCINNNASATLTGDVYEYHYTLYYYDQSGNLVKTIPPEGVRFLSEEEMEKVRQFREAGAAMCAGTGIPATEEKESVLNAFSTKLQESTLKSMELWLYNAGSAASRQVRFVTPDHKYLYQAAIHDHKLWVELYSLLPDPPGGIAITLSNSAVADLGAQTLQSWSHLVLQSSSFPSAAWDLYLDGKKLTVLPNGPAYPFEWEIQGGYTLPTEKLADLKHLRIYDRLITPDEIYKNYANSCLSPIPALAVQSSPLLKWGRFNIPAPGSETTTGEGSTTEFVNRFIAPLHGLPTYYAYNSQNSVVRQTSPDGGTSQFWYDRLGRLVISQNGEQLQSSTSDASNRYTYTTYDAQGRIKEVGEKTGSNKIVTEVLARTESLLNDFYGTGANRQVIQNIYDEAPAGAPGLLTNLRKRIAASVYKETGIGPIQQASYYNYDISGNVKNLFQYNLQLVTVDANSGIKRIDYEYDLVSGKTNMVKYQEGKGDQFYHKYQYDADNRIIEVQTSRDKLTWATEAIYRYYLHGPLARKELGNDNGSTGKVQGVDYAYTLQGWLKGVNSQKLDVNADMGQDGKPGGDFPLYARDVMGFSLGYFGGDYNAIDGGTTFSLKYVHNTTLPNTSTGNELFNGNIANITLAVSKLENGAVKGYTYRYDQLNRLKQMRMHAIGSGANAWNNSGILDTYKEDISYDANGNIQTYVRHGNNPNKLLMDNLTYHYNRDGANQLLNNRLLDVHDEVGDDDYTNDIDRQGSGNYQYDRIGNLIYDAKENLETVKWTVNGKIDLITKGIEGPGSTVTTIDYKYDAAGNRVSKEITVKPYQQPEVITKTFYVRDAQGNVMGVYKQGSDNKLWWQEQHLYGSNRLGIWKPGLEVTPTWQAPGEGGGTIVLGQRNYELTNHLGNVIAVITDKKNPLSGGGFEAEVLTATDYYPFGMQMPGRSLDGPGCHDVVQDLTELKGSSDLNEGAVQNGLEVNHNGVRWARMTATSTITLYNQAIKCENGGGSSDGVLAYIPSTGIEANATYIFEFDITDKSPTITYFGCQAHTNGDSPYRVMTRKTGLGHHSIIFTTPSVLPQYIRLRISANQTGIGTWFVVDNFVARKFQVVNEVEVIKANFNEAVVNTGSITSGGMEWSNFVPTANTISLIGTADKKFKVTCTTVDESRIKGDFDLSGGGNYILRFNMAQDVEEKRLNLRMYSFSNGVWTAIESLTSIYMRSGDQLFNFVYPTGATRLRLEFLRSNSGESYDGYNVPYTLDNVSVSRIDPVASQTTIVCDPGADPTGDNSIYRYGFNGKENDNEVKGAGNQLDFGNRIYDSRLGRFLSVDRLTSGTPELSPYSSAANNPIKLIDIDGDLAGLPPPHIIKAIMKTNTFVFISNFLSNNTSNYHLYAWAKGWKEGKDNYTSLIGAAGEAVAFKRLLNVGFTLPTTTYGFGVPLSLAFGQYEGKYPVDIQEHVSVYNQWRLLSNRTMSAGVEYSNFDGSYGGISVYSAGRIGERFDFTINYEVKAFDSETDAYALYKGIEKGFKQIKDRSSRKNTAGVLIVDKAAWMKLVNHPKYGILLKQLYDTKGPDRYVRLMENLNKDAKDALYELGREIRKADREEKEKKKNE